MCIRDSYASDPLLVRQVILDWAQNSRNTLVDLGRALSRNMIKLLLTLTTVYFFYRDGTTLVGQSGQILKRFFDDRLNSYIRSAGSVTRAVIFGLLVTAFVQGTIAGVGFAIFNVQAPVLLGAITAIASIVPVVGTFLVWGSVGIFLLISGHVWPGIGLIAWGTVLVHPADNVIRPLLISNVTQMPFLLTMFGILGGLATFGLVGLFIGPVALAIAVAVWQEWLERSPDPDDRTAARPPPTAPNGPGV